MEWRLDIEIASRNLSNHQLKPKYMIRIDFTDEDLSSIHTNLNNPIGNSTMANTNIESVHLELDYANMKNLQRELQTALDQMNSLHCQRFNKYIS